MTYAYDPAVQSRDNIRAAAEEWLDFLALDRKARPTTVKAWRSAITCWLNEIPDELPGDHRLAKEAFYLALHRRLPDDHKAVRQKTWDALSVFYSWWQERGGPPSPLRNMRRPKQSRVKRPPLTEAQVDAAVSRVLRLTDMKPRAIIYLSALSGARPSDIVALHVDDVDRRPGRERIRFRDRKSDGGDEWHPLSPVMADTIGLYLDQYDVPGGYLFPGRRGRMTVQAISMVWARVVGVGEDGMPSQARKYFADTLKRSGEDLDTVRALLGHAQLQTTQIYLHTDEEDGRRGVIDLGAAMRARESRQRRGPGDYHAPTTEAR